MEPIFQTYRQALAGLDEQTAALSREFASQMQCRRGCSGCCLNGFRIRYVEGAYLLKGFAEAPPQIAARILAQLADPDAKRCPVLVDDACALYEHRPALCRAYGHIVRVNGTNGTCELNFNNPPPQMALKVLDLDPYYELLDELSASVWQALPHRRNDPPPLASIRDWLQSFLNSRTQAQEHEEPGF